MDWPPNLGILIIVLALIEEIGELMPVVNYLVSGLSDARTVGLLTGEPSRHPLLRVTLDTATGNSLEFSLTQTAALQLSEVLSRWLQSADFQ